MKTGFSAVAIGLGMSFGLGSAHADDWAGYYVGIDRLDGSLDRLSIVPQGDGPTAFVLPRANSARARLPIPKP